MAGMSTLAASSSSFPEEVLDLILHFLPLPKDRNAASAVNKAWYNLDRLSRRHIFIPNCYALSPNTLVRRFKDIRSIEIKGKPHFADYNLVPEGWGGHVFQWIVAMAAAYPLLEEIRLKRMVITDEGLELISKSFKNFKVLVLKLCDGFSDKGLAAIAANCKNLRELDLHECDEVLSGQWLSHFPDTFTSLVSLNISSLVLEVDSSVLDRLVARCPNLKSLRLNRTAPIERIPDLLQRAPQLTEFGTGAFAAELHPDLYTTIAGGFSKCKQLKSLSGFWDVVPDYLPAVYSVCSGLTSLNLTDATIPGSDLVKLVTQCPRLQRLLVMDYIEDTGLEAVAMACKELQELRVFPSEPYSPEPNVTLTEKGLLSVSKHCSKLHTVLYFCRQMSNAALVSIAQNRPNLIRFRLCILKPKLPDYLTQEPLDTGFGAIAEHCKSLKRLSVSGLLTDEVFHLIGKHAKKLEMLSLAFAGDSDLGLHYVLSGCDSLKKLEIRDCPFGDQALLANAAKLEAMRSLWMSNCLVTFGACKRLGKTMKRVNVEVMDDDGPPDLSPDDCDNCVVDKVYVYRTVGGPRLDKPGFVWTTVDDTCALTL